METTQTKPFRGFESSLAYHWQKRLERTLTLYCLELLSECTERVWKLALDVYAYPYLLHTMAAVTSRTLLAHRRPSPLAIATANGKQSVGDSSDDEDLAPIKLSAEAEEILGEDAALMRSARKQFGNFYGNDAIRSSEQRDSEPQVHQRRRLGSLSPDQSNGSPLPRVIRVNSGPRPTIPGMFGRDGSFLYKNLPKTTEPESQPPQDLITPAPRLRRVRVSGGRSQNRSPPSKSSINKTGSAGIIRKEEHNTQEEDSPDGVDQKAHRDGEEPMPIGPSTVTRPRRGDENGVQSTMRVKRVGAGSFLTGPVRRGMIRRQSDEDDEDDVHTPQGSPKRVLPKDEDHALELVEGEVDNLQL